MFKEIDARKKALKKKKEYYDYDKTIKKKTDEIELIKQQIRGLEGLTDAESNAQKARLEASLKDKQDNLDDTVRDHVYDITVNGLDDLETQLSEDFEKWSNQLSSDLAKMSDAISNAISGAGENYSDMMAGIDYILNNIGGITSGQYFTSQDKSNMKKSNSFDTGYNSGHLKGYANGTKHVGSNRIAMTNENGREIIVTKDGWITPLEASDMVIPNDIKVALQGYDNWLRLNNSVNGTNNPFTYGIYCGNGTLKTNGEFQVGDGGNCFKANSSAITCNKSLIVNAGADFGYGATIRNAGLELYFSTPFIDFHFDNSNNDSITADKIKANAITADKITTNNISGTNGWINLRSGTFKYNDGALAWDGSTMTIGGFKISKYKITNDAIGICSTSGQEWAFWAGASSGGNAPFHVGHNGNLYASKIKRRCKRFFR